MSIQLVLTMKLRKVMEPVRNVENSQGQVRASWYVLNQIVTVNRFSSILAFVRIAQSIQGHSQRDIVHQMNARLVRFFNLQAPVVIANHMRRLPAMEKHVLGQNVGNDKFSKVIVHANSAQTTPKLQRANAWSNHAPTDSSSP